jgi:poly(A) polymerase
LLTRYGTSPEGKPVKKAEVYTAEDHHIDPALIDPDARRIIERLRREGFKAFIVGGAVRDLLTGLKPKDFDIATDALPRRIRRIFRDSRIIGRRFRLVHIYTHRNGKRKIFEVSTFRSNQHSESDSGSSIYGRMEEDVWRRDFTVNALYYCPIRRIIVDFVGGYRDIREEKICTLVPTDASFKEDPVRMIRGIKYAEMTGFPLPGAINASIKRHRGRLVDCSPARLTEEVYKILRSGYAAGIFLRTFRLKLLEVFMPELHGCWQALGRRELLQNLRSGLGTLDQRVKNDPGATMSRGTMLAYLLKSFSKDWTLVEDLRQRPQQMRQRPRQLPRQMQPQAVEETAAWIRKTCRPLRPSSKESDRAARLLLRWATA